MRRRVLLGFLTLTVFVLGVLEIPLGITNAHRQSDELTTQLERDAFFIASITEDSLEHNVRTGLRDQIVRYQRRYGPRVVVVDAQSRVVADSDPQPSADKTMRTRPEIGLALRGQVATGRRHSATLHTDLLYVAVPVASGGKVHGVVRLTYSTSVLDQRVRRYWWGLGLVALVSLAAAAALGMVLARSATRPLRSVQQATTRFGAGQLAERAPVTGPVEVRAMATTFNDMADRLEGLLDAQETFVADASHQLRTPLTALRLRLENIQTEVGPDGIDDADAALQEVARMSRLVDGLLLLARADREAGTATATTIDVAAVLEERRSMWEPVATERGVEIDLALPDGGVWARATPDRLDQVLDNLLANALDSSPRPGGIALRAETRNHETTIHVIDEGPGLSAEDRGRAFDRFWRTGSAPAQLGGSGLGLSIVRKLVTADGGTVQLRAATPRGIDAVVTLRSAPGGHEHGATAAASSVPSGANTRSAGV